MFNKTAADVTHQYIFFNWKTKQIISFHSERQEMSQP